MSFFSELLKKLKKQPAAPLRNTPPKAGAEPAAKSASSHSAADPLAELRYQARTGNPAAPVRHHSGSFKEED